ncbi:MAG: hypothetical protein M3R06_09090, partial [Chloroflexota bacterium]|nr:hypothetical protein [Chloroflexota bacterium]
VLTLQSTENERPKVKNKRDVLEFLASRQMLEEERTFVIYLDSGLGVVDLRAVRSGTSISASNEAASLVAQGITLQAAGILVVDNCPNGKSWPNAPSGQLLSQLEFLTRETGICVLDSLSISGNVISSYALPRHEDKALEARRFPSFKFWGNTISNRG